MNDAMLKNNPKRPVWFIGPIMLLASQLVVGAAHAEIYKCTNKQGSVYYNDKPCPVEDDEKKINNEKDPVNGYVPPGFVKDKGAQRKGAMVGERHSRALLNSEQQTSQDEVLPEDSVEDPHKGAAAQASGSASSSDLKSSQTTRFAAENVKINHMPEKASHPAPEAGNRRSDGRMSLKEKKAFLGIHSEPE